MKIIHTFLCLSKDMKLDIVYLYLLFSFVSIELALTKWIRFSKYLFKYFLYNTSHSVIVIGRLMKCLDPSELELFRIILIINSHIDLKKIVNNK